MLRVLSAAGFLILFLAAHAGATGTAAVRWTPFIDPAEKAFTVEVPAGWTVKGGIIRLGFSDARAMVDMTSPDGRINVRLGDVAVPPYVEPTQYHAREGETYDLGAQAQMVVARYRTGPEFAVLYSHARFHALCHNPRGDSTPSGISLPDVVPSETPPDQSSSGAISYRCDAPREPQGYAVAFAWAKTALFKSIWGVTPLASFYAPADQVELARAVLLRSAKSFQLRPEWLQYQKQMDAQGLEYQRARQQQRMVALGQQVQQFESRMAAMRAQVSAFERHQAAQAAQVESFTNVLNGITPTVDPLTGEARQVWTGPAGRYWANGLGEVVNSNSQPSASFHEIQPLQ
jgi:hypothetical protein